ncbi:hypothetical protein HMPREF0527_01579 [Lactobacillus jensenii SJ-7A-US]|jgi:hypothetical protein|nr:hypothetical protein HMPREF0527_01579 [Lactobacillus jensenii SJ-7A-US]
MVLAKKSESQTNNEASVQSMINKYVKRAHESLDIMANFDQEIKFVKRSQLRENKIITP